MSGLTHILAGYIGLNAQTFLVAILVFLIVYWMLQKPVKLNLPPKVRRVGVPFFGVFFGVDKENPMEWTYQLVLEEPHSDIKLFPVAGQNLVLLNSQDVIKQAFQTQGDEFDGRPGLMFKTITKGYGLVSSEGLLWKEQRRFALSVLRDFGMGKMGIEDKIHDEAYYMLEEMSKPVKEGSPFSPDEYFEIAVSNIICSVCFGKRFEYEDKEFRHMLQLFRDNLLLQGQSMALNYLPWVRHLPGDFFGYKKLMKNMDAICDFVEDRLGEHKSSFNKLNIRDYIDAYLAEVDNRGSDISTFTNRQLLYSVIDLFGAGSETTTSTLRWALLCMIRYPDVQQKVQQEIDKQIPSGRSPNMKDRLSLPYTSATLDEIQRYASILPFGAPHRAVCDTKLNGYDIPKDTIVCQFTFGIHRDEKIWKNPKKFDPENFLDADGNLVNQEHLIPFGVGKRSCMGEGLAKMELFLFFTAMMQKFSFSIDDSKPPPSEKRSIGLVNAPKDQYTVIAKPRQ